MSLYFSSAPVNEGKESAAPASSLFVFKSEPGRMNLQTSPQNIAVEKVECGEVSRKNPNVTDAKVSISFHDSPVGEPFQAKPAPTAQMTLTLSASRLSSSHASSAGSDNGSLASFIAADGAGSSPKDPRTGEQAHAFHQEARGQNKGKSKGKGKGGIAVVIQPQSMSPGSKEKQSTREITVSLSSEDASKRKKKKGSPNVPDTIQVKLQDEAGAGSSGGSSSKTGVVDNSVLITSDRSLLITSLIAATKRAFPQSASKVANYLTDYNIANTEQCKASADILENMTPTNKRLYNVYLKCAQKSSFSGLVVPKRVTTLDQYISYLETRVA